MTLKKRSPCVGICSTTYGDLVCRGCKRFAHEIVAWNGYNDEQHARVWRRLLNLREQVVDQNLCVLDPVRYQQACVEAGTSSHGTEQIHDLLRFMVKSNLTLEWAGLVSLLEEVDALCVLQKIDAEIYRRSLAHYERNFKIPV